MNAKIDQLTTAEEEWIIQQLKEARTFVQQILDQEPTDLPSPEDLDQAFNSWLHSPSHDPAQANSIVNFIGIAFGQTPCKYLAASVGHCV